MPPKQAVKIDNLPIASSSEEEEDESGSSGEESECSDDGEALSKLTQKTVATAAKKAESDSEEAESESDSSSDSEPATKTKSLNTVVTKPRPETSGSTAAVTLPESCTGKRPLKQTHDEPNKKVKISTTGSVKKNPATTADEEVKKISGEEAKKMFQRLFSGTDEIAMLQGFLDFTSTRGDPYENMDAFCDYVKTLIDFNASKSQIVTKLRRCKKKFVNIVKNSLKKGKTEDMIKYSKDLDQKAFELSRKIWGSNGFLPAKPRKKSKEIKLLPPPKKEVEMGKQEVDVVVDTRLSSSRELALFFKAENVSVFGLDESTVSTVWDMVEDGQKKREMEEKLKKLKDTQVELCLLRTALVDTTAKMIFKYNASSSS